jgi:hypothetical protein
MEVSHMIALLNRVFEYKKLPFILGGLIFASSLALLTVFKTAESQLAQLDNARKVAKEMSKSSDDLTAYARYYVTTKNDKWKTEFEKVLQIRNGEIANEDGLQKSFKEKVKSVGFEQPELDLILKSEQLSNELAKLEIKAFKYIEDYKAEKEPEAHAERLGILAVQAEMAMFGEDYQKHKSLVMNTANEFYNAVHNRLDNAYKKSMTIAWILITVINLALLMLMIFIQHSKETIAPNKPVKQLPAKKPVRKRKPSVPKVANNQSS